MTWPRALGQVPIFFGLRPSGRPMNPADHYTSKYLDVSNEPLYPFGHGLTYGSFEYSKLCATPAQVKQTDRIEVEVELSNSGRHEAEETVFLFTRDRVACVARPLLELRGVGKLRLKPGESGSVKISFDANELAFPGLDLKPVFEAGEVEVLAGPSADRAKLLSTLIRLI
jgi:beta-glucosidase